jgi:hypothetical protein
MHDSNELAALERAIRASVAAGPLSAASALLPRYVAAVELQLRRFPHTPERVQPLERRTYEFLGWLTAMALSTRETAATELSRLQSLASYGGPQAANRHVHADG